LEARLKKKMYHALSFGHEKIGDKGREHEDGFLRAPLADFFFWETTCCLDAFAEPSETGSGGCLRAPCRVATCSYLVSGRPPIVDFTRFEDRYQSPSNDYDALFSVSKGKKKNDYKCHTFL